LSLNLEEQVDDIRKELIVIIIEVIQSSMTCTNSKYYCISLIQTLKMTPILTTLGVVGSTIFPMRSR
jgi:hypothetical protein